MSVLTLRSSFTYLALKGLRDQADFSRWLRSQLSLSLRNERRNKGVAGYWFHE